MNKFKFRKQVNNEFIKFFSSKTLFYIFLAIIIGCLVYAVTIYSTVETVGSDYEKNMQFEVEEIEEILATSTMDDDYRNYLIEKREIALYMIENNIKPIEIHSTANMLMSSNDMFYLLVILFVLAATRIICVEYDNKAIMNLYSRAQSRLSVFLAKNIVLVVFALLLIVFTYIVLLGVGVAFWGLDSLNANIVSYSDGIVVRSVTGQYLYNSCYNLVTLLGCASLVMMLCVVLKNSLISACVGILTYYFGSTLVLALSNYEFLKYSFFANIQFSIYNSGLKLFEGMTNLQSVLNIIIHIIVFSVISVLFMYKGNTD